MGEGGFINEVLTLGLLEGPSQLRWEVLAKLSQMVLTQLLREGPHQVAPGVQTNFKRLVPRFSANGTGNVFGFSELPFGDHDHPQTPAGGPAAKTLSGAGAQIFCHLRMQFQGFPE